MTALAGKRGVLTIRRQFALGRIGNVGRCEVGLDVGVMREAPGEIIIVPVAP